MKLNPTNEYCKMVLTLVKGVGEVGNGGDLPMIAKKFSVRWHLLNLVRLRNIMKMKPTLLEPLPFAVLEILLIKMLSSGIQQTNNKLLG